MPFSRCSGGHAGNGGDWERATDPWVSFGPDGTAHWMALVVNNVRNGENAMLEVAQAVSRMLGFGGVTRANNQRLPIREVTEAASGFGHRDRRD